MISRKKFSLDGWCREITFDFPVRNIQIWDAQKKAIRQLLAFLTGDVWNLNFTQSQIVNHYIPMSNAARSEFIPEKICLFSGGLDSLVGVYKLLEANKKTLLVSHYDRDMHGPHSDQKNIVDKLNTRFNRFDNFDWTYNRVGAVQGNSKKLETTFRSRSILFLGMASYLAHNLTPNITFNIPENGTISLNIPLSPSRRSSCSTKTTHPYILLSLNKIFMGLGIRTSVENPFELLTKGEMLQPFSSDLFFKSLVDLSNSCGKGGHKRWWYKFAVFNDSGTIPHHCGKCMPCIYRRAAMNKADWDDNTFYGDNIFNFTHWSWKNESKHKRFKDVKTLLQFIAQDKQK
jgi:7-cyano-7-deazaguanine synthase in queuosine biosynthesis